MIALLRPYNNADGSAAPRTPLLVASALDPEPVSVGAPSGPDRRFPEPPAHLVDGPRRRVPSVPFNGLGLVERQLRALPFPQVADADAEQPHARSDVHRGEQGGGGAGDGGTGVRRLPDR